MANKQISQLNVNTNPTLDDILPIVNNSETKQISLSGFSDFIGPYITAGGFDGGTVTGETIFISGVTADTITTNGLTATIISATTYYNTPVSAVDAGFSVTANTSVGLWANVNLPQNSTVTYPTPLITNGFVVTIPASTTLTII